MLVSYRLLRERYPEASITVFSNNTSNNKDSVYPAAYNQYIPKLLGDEVDLIDWTQKSHFDLIFYGGGGHYFDHSRGPSLLRIVNPLLSYLLGPQRIWRFERIVRKILLKPLNQFTDLTIGVGIGIGRFTDGSKSFLQQLSELGSYDYLWVRDNYSLNYLINTRFKSRLVKYTDIAFISNYWMPTFITKSPESVKKIGIILMYLNHQESAIYTQLMIFIELARDKGLEVSLFIFDETYDRSVYSAFSNQEINTWQPNKIGLNDFLSEFKKCQITVSLRAHGAIISGILGMIPICIESSLKLKEVAKMFPNSGKLLSLKSDAQSLMKTIDDITMEYPNYLKRLEQDLEINTKSALNGVADLNEFLR